MEVPRKIKLKSLTSYITCYICKGYLIDATTVTECLHTFCKSCLVKHLEEGTSCPKCEQLIHQSHPKNYISYDRSIQDVVYKLVPGLYEEEMKRRKEFYASKGMTFDGVIESTFAESKQAKEKEMCQESQQTTSEKVEANGDYHRSDEQVSLQITCATSGLNKLSRCFVRCSTQATVTHLKKFIAKHIFEDMSRFREIDILCNAELMGKDHTLKFILKTRWRCKSEPLDLEYRRHIEI